MTRFERPQKSGVIAVRVESRVVVISVMVGLASFLLTEAMHLLLVPNLGRHFERLLAEAVSAVVVAGLTAGLMEAANQRQQAALLRMQVISEMNHHIRNALLAISATTDSISNQQAVQTISDSVDLIEWTLREVLLRKNPISESEIDRLRYAARRKAAAMGLQRPEGERDE